LLQLREKLADSTTPDETVVEQIRTYDFYVRRAFFGNQEQRRMGGVLLLGGAVVCFIALKLSWRWNPKLPAVGKTGKINHAELNALFRQLMAGMGLFLVVVSLFLAFAVRSDLPTVLARADEQAGKPAPQTEKVALSVLPTEMKANWPSLRGPGGIGVAYVSDAPINWNIKTGEGVLWKAEIPVYGFNSPIIWGDRIFMSGGDDEGFEVFCFDANTGKLRWSKTVKATTKLPKVSKDTGFAAPTMTTDGTRVFAIFATGDLTAFDFNGNVVWQKNIGLPKNPYGMGSSLISDRTRLFIQYDHEKQQQVMALDCATGKSVWTMPRKHISWASPTLMETPSGLQLVLNDEANVTAYDPVTGKQLWQVKCLGGEVAPSPAFNGKDIVFVANEYAQASALKLKEGETPEILWQYDEYLPEISSPLATEKFFFITTSAGDIVCLDAATGKSLWEEEFDEGFSSSPVLAGKYIYAIDIKGVVHIFEAAAEYKEVAILKMGEPVYATPAFANNRIYIRCGETLYCIGK
jgi:outer membrane protein assembly factor BamB